MTDEKPKRKPAGAAVPGAVERPVNYTKTLSLMVTEDIYDRLSAEAEATGKSKAQIAREWLERGSEPEPIAPAPVADPEPKAPKKARRPLAWS